MARDHTAAPAGSAVESSGGAVLRGVLANANGVPTNAPPDGRAYGPGMSTRRALAALAAVSFLFVSRTALAENPNGDPTCALEHHVGIGDEDARAVEEVVCSEATSRKEPLRYRVRVSKLGHQLVVRLATEHGGRTTSDRQLVLSGIDEVPVAAPRLVDAAIADKPVAETRTVDNVVGGEVRTKKSQPARVNGYLGMTGAGTFVADATAGVYVGLSGGNARWSFVGDARLTGNMLASTVELPLAILSLGKAPDLSSNSSFGSLSGGVRHHFSESDTALFTGMGIGLDHVGFRESTGRELANTGLGVHGELGLDILRASTVGGVVFLRMDAPAFTPRETKPAPRIPSQPAQPTSERVAWMPIASLGVSMRF